jgi:DNA-binding MarR family transcriptional regulator
MGKYDNLKLDAQLCFPLYACSKEVIRRYKPFLDELDLTYTQYITMMVLWEHHSIRAKELGEKLYLDSGTLTPLLKKLEQKGYITRKRAPEDERNLIIEATEKGMDLREKALSVPEHIRECVATADEDAQELYRLLYKVLGNMTSHDREM